MKFQTDLLSLGKIVKEKINLSYTTMRKLLSLHKVQKMWFENLKEVLKKEKLMKCGFGTFSLSVPAGKQKRKNNLTLCNQLEIQLSHAGKTLYIMQCIFTEPLVIQK